MSWMYLSIFILTDVNLKQNFESSYDEIFFNGMSIHFFSRHSLLSVDLNNNYCKFRPKNLCELRTIIFNVISPLLLFHILSFQLYYQFQKNNKTIFREKSADKSANILIFLFTIFHWYNIISNNIYPLLSWDYFIINYVDDLRMHSNRNFQIAVKYCNFSHSNPPKYK